jgi:hypothetical protein
LFEPIKRFVNRDDLERIAANEQRPFIGIDLGADTVAAMFEAGLTPRIFHEDPTHGLGSSRKKVAPAVPFCRFVHGNQPKIGLVHQRRGLERLPRLLSSQFMSRQLAQFVVDQWQ